MLKKDLESFKNEFNFFKSDHAMSKKVLNSLNNEFYDYLIKSLKVNDNLVKLNNDILIIKMNIMLLLEIRAPLLIMIH